MKLSYAELAKELEVTNKLLAERQEVINAIPECSVHGGNCVPNALGWITEQKEGNINSIPTVINYQQKIGKWLIDCFGEEIAQDQTERCFRFLEESLELVQSLGVTKEQAAKLLDYVFDRPIGEPKQEVGGVMVTLAALCFAGNISLSECAVTEYVRILAKIDKIRAKHQSKPQSILSPIPGNSQS